MVALRLDGQCLIGILGSGLFLVQALSAHAEGPSFHFIAEVKGEVKIQRVGRLTDQKAHVGSNLYPTDQLKLDKNSAVKVLCGNVFLWVLKQPGVFQVSKGCKSDRRILSPFNANRIPTRNPYDPLTPYLISPRNTNVLAAQPWLRWHPVQRVTRYQVSVSGPEVDWQTTVSQPQVKYTGPVPLQPGQRYWVTVVAENGELSKRDEVGFTVLDTTKAAQFQQDLAQLQRQEVSQEGKTLAMAYLEASYELYAAAIARLTAWQTQGYQSAVTARILGDLYWQVELPELAKPQYIQGLKLMRQAGNREGEAEILLGLARVEESLANLNQAIAGLESAQEIYQALGDTQTVQELENKLLDLKQRV